MSLALRAAAVVAAAPFLGHGAASAHGIAGKRFFPATLTTDDPFVADEFSFPTISTIRTPGSDEGPPARDTEAATEFAKRITPNLGFSIAERYIRIDPDGGSSQYGWGNTELQLKYQFFKSDEHETILSFGTSFEIGGSGTQRVGADRFNTLTPTLFFGKGFGDLPDSLNYLKPVAITGAIGGAIPLRSSSNVYGIDPDTGAVTVDTQRHSNVLQYGFALEYSLQYLQSFVKDVGLGAPFNRMIPLVEFAFQSPLDRNGGGMTGTINPGVIWAGQFFQLGVEAMIPINERTGHNVGAIVQLHFFLDDLFPGSLGRPLVNW
jgi:hypothetical protein